MTNPKDDLEILRCELERKRLEHAPAIPRESVLKWMANPDVEVKGAVYALTSNEEQTQRISPPLTLEMDRQFVLSYFGQCIAEDPPQASEFAESRFSACCNLLEWFRALWNDRTIPREQINPIKEWIAQQYREGDFEVRRTLVQATLEHLFEDPGIKDFFSDWEAKDTVCTAYREAKAWSERSIKSH